MVGMFRRRPITKTRRPGRREGGKEGGGKEEGREGLPEIQKTSWFHGKRAISAMSVNGWHVQRTANHRDTAAGLDDNVFSEGVVAARKEGDHWTRRICEEEGGREGGRGGEGKFIFVF